MVPTRAFTGRPLCEDTEKLSRVEGPLTPISVEELFVERYWKNFNGKMKFFVALLVASLLVGVAVADVKPLHLKLGASQTRSLTRASRMLPLAPGGKIGPVIPMGMLSNTIFIAAQPHRAKTSAPVRTSSAYTFFILHFTCTGGNLTYVFLLNLTELFINIIKEA